MQYVLPGGHVVTVATDSPAGLVGTIGVKLLNAQDLSVAVARTTAGIIEHAEGDGQSTYRAILTAPTTAGTYIAEWDNGTTTSTDSELIRVTSSTQIATAGGTYFTTSELRAAYRELTTDAYPDDAVEAASALAIQALEDACNVAFIPRAATDLVTAQVPSGARALTHTPVRSITSATDGAGNTLDVTDASIDGRWTTIAAGWPVGQVTITYQHGYDGPPLRVKQAAMILTREWLISGPVTDRQTQLPTEGGGSVNLSVPGGRFGTFGIPEVDAVVAQYARNSLVA